MSEGGCANKGGQERMWPRHSLRQLRRGVEPVWQLGLLHHHHSQAASNPLSLASPAQYFVSGTHLILHPDMFDSDGPCFDVYCNSRHGWKKFCRPLSLQHCRSHLVNVHRKQTFSRNSPNFVIFISVLPCFHIESSGRSWRV